MSVKVASDSFHRAMKTHWSRPTIPMPNFETHDVYTQCRTSFGITYRTVSSPQKDDQRTSLRPIQGSCPAI